MLAAASIVIPHITVPSPTTTHPHTAVFSAPPRKFSLLLFINQKPLYPSRPNNYWHFPRDFSWHNPLLPSCRTRYYKVLLRHTHHSMCPGAYTFRVSWVILPSAPGQWISLFHRHLDQCMCFYKQTYSIQREYDICNTLAVRAATGAALHVSTLHTFIPRDHYGPHFIDGQQLRHRKYN